MLFGINLLPPLQVGMPSGRVKQTFEDHGTVLAFDPPHVMKYNYWSSFAAAELPDLPENYQTITYTFEPNEQGTLVTIEQDIRSA